MIATKEESVSRGDLSTLVAQPYARYWFSKHSLSNEGIYAPQQLSANLSRAHRHHHVPRRWSNQLGEWEYALHAEEIENFCFAPHTFNDSSLERLLTGEQGNEFIQKINSREAWYWVKRTTFDHWPGTFESLHIYRNLCHAVKEGQVGIRIRDNEKEFLVRGAYIPMLAFRDPSCFTNEELKKRTTDEEMYALRLRALSDQKNSRVLAGMLWGAWLGNQIGMIPPNNGEERIYFLRKDQQIQYGIVSISSETPPERIPAESREPGEPRKKQRTGRVNTVSNSRKLQQDEGEVEKKVKRRGNLKEGNGLGQYLYELDERGTVLRLNPEDEVRLGKEINERQHRLRELFFKSDVGIDMFVDYCSEIVTTNKNKIKGIVEVREEEKSLITIVVSTLEKLQREQHLQRSDYHSLRETQTPKEKEDLLATIDSRKQRMSQLIEDLPLKGDVATLLVGRYLRQCEESRDYSSTADWPIDTVRMHYRVYKEARDELVMRATSYMLAIMKKYYGKGIPHMDLVMEGNVALMRAADYWDYTFGVRFIHFASSVICNHIRNAFNSKNLVRIKDKRIFGQIRTIKEEMLQEQGRNPTFEELCAISGKAPWLLRSLEELSKSPLSLDFTGSGEEGKTMYDILPKNETSTFDRVTQDEQRHITHSLLDRLSHQEATILRMRHGISNGRFCVQETSRILKITEAEVLRVEKRIQSVLGKPSDQIRQEDIALIINALNSDQREIAQAHYHLPGRAFTLKEIGNLLGLTRERIRQIEGIAIKKLQRYARLNLSIFQDEED